MLQIISTLKGQIVISILIVMAYPVFTDYYMINDDVVTTIDGLNLLIQIVGLCWLFGIIKNGKGSEFKVTRMFIAMVLWDVVWTGGFLPHTQLLERVQAHEFDRFLPKAVILASCNALVVAMIVLLSYVIGEGINKIVKEKTLFNRSTLTGQMTICSLLFLPIPVMLMLPEIFEFSLTFLIPVVVFCVLFLQGNSKGVEFKVTRIILAALLWGAFYVQSLIWGYDEMLKLTGLDKLIIQVSNDHFPIDYYLNKGLYSSYNAMGIAVAVILSYVIGKWINSKLGGQISEKRA